LLPIGLSAAVIKPSYYRHRDAAVFSHNQLGRRRQLIRNRDRRNVQFPSVPIFLTAQIYYWLYACNPKLDVQAPLPPGPAKGVGYDDGELQPQPLLERTFDPPG